MNQKLKFIREKLNLTEKEVSAFLNISSYKYAVLEKAGTNIPCESILLLAKLYGIKAEMIIKSKYTNEDLLYEISNNNLLDNSKERLNGILKYNLLGNETALLSYRSIKKVKSTIQQNIINRLLLIIKENNFSKHDLAVVLGMNVETLESILSGRRFTSTSELINISNKFNVSVSDMIK